MKNLKTNMYENSRDIIPLAISLPADIANYLAADSFEEAKNNIEKLTPVVQELAKRAFQENDKSAWSQVQNLLYYFNYNDITRKNRMNGFSSVVENVLRKYILDIQHQFKTKPVLSCVTNFTPERAVEELALHAREHRINNHPLLEHMAKNGLKSKEQVHHFLTSYYVNNRLFHLFIVTLSLFTPLEGRTELANNFYDELGSGDGAMAHPVLFLKNFDTIGRPTEINPLPEALCLANAKTFAAYLSGDYHYGMGGFGFIELTMPEQMKKILAGLEKSNLPEKDLEFWRVHITIDLEHGATWFREMLELVQTPEQAQKCLQGGIDLLNARATMYDGILAAIQKDL